MIIVMFMLFVVAALCVVYWFKLQKTQQLHASRIQRYLELIPEKSTESSHILLFNKNHQLKGWRLWLFVHQQR